MSAEPPYLTDDEVREICAGIEQPAAMIRFLRSTVKVSIVLRKPNGMPLVGREAFRLAMGTPQESVTGPMIAEQPNRAALRAHFSARR